MEPEVEGPERLRKPAFHSSSKKDNRPQGARDIFRVLLAASPTPNVFGHKRRHTIPLYTAPSCQFSVFLLYSRSSPRDP